uniref:hypothetical protein n=1 Tax=Eubacterium sp. TaxID=142586 RepID=UPI004029A95D
MKKKSILLLLTFVFCLTIVLTGCATENTDSSVQSTENETMATSSTTEAQQRQTDFRNVCWGDDIETVKQSEDAQLYAEDESSLVYTVDVSGHTMDLCYAFEDGKLYQAIYGDKCGHTTSGQFISGYESLKESLTELYGTPKTDDIINTVDQDLVDAAGSSALDFGYVVYRATWENEKTKIQLGCMSENYKTNLIISYTDINYEENLENSGL